MYSLLKLGTFQATQSLCNKELSEFDMGQVAVGSGNYYLFFKVYFKECFSVFDIFMSTVRANCIVTPTLCNELLYPNPYNLHLDQGGPVFWENKFILNDKFTHEVGFIFELM